MDIKCPHCGTEYDIDKSEYGRYVKCEICGKGFVAGTSASKKLGKAASAATDALKTAANTADERVKNADRKNMQEQAKTATGPAHGQGEESRCQAEVYVCTHCGEKSTSPKRTWLGCLGGLGIIVAFIGGGFFGMIHPLIGIAVFIMGIVGSIVRLGQSNKTYCKKCGKYDTMISAISPQGRRLLNEDEHDLREVSPQPSREPSRSDVADRLNRLQKLLDEGLVSVDEYKKQRQHILDSI